jgi:hypothetical protein
MGGAGIDLPLTPRLRLHGEARAIVLSTQTGSDISRPEQTFVNPMLRVGATFGLGGRQTARPDVVTRVEADRRLLTEREAAELQIAELERDIRVALARGDSIQAARLEAQQAAAFRTARPFVEGEGEFITVTDAAGRQMVVRRPTADAAVLRPERQTITIPVPEQGEIYIRYGEAGAIQVGPETAAPAALGAPTDDQIRTLVRDAVREALGAEAPPVAASPGVEAALTELLRREAAREGAELTATEAALLERRLMDRLYQELRDIRSTRDDRPIIIQQPTTVVAADGTTRVLPATGGRFVAAQPISGFSFSRHGPQFLLGVRMDYRTGPALTGLRYYPEVLIGVGGRSSISLNVNGVAPLPTFDPELLPYAGLGLGITSFRGSEQVDFDEFFGEIGRERDARSFLLGINTLLGAEYALGSDRIFFEVGAVNLTRLLRLSAGYRFDF